MRVTGGKKQARVLNRGFTRKDADFILYLTDTHLTRRRDWSEPPTHEEIRVIRT
jgi:hypothetical protein